MIESSYKVIRVIEKNPDYTQRKIAKELGYSLGKVNYIIAALTEKGLIKLYRFLNSKNKVAYRYVLTPEGIKKKYNITRAFIRKKSKEYENIAKEIKEAEKVLKSKQ